MSANRTPLLDELCSFYSLDPYQDAIDAICLFDGRIRRRWIAIWLACLPPPVFGYVSVDRRAFRWRDLVSASGLVLRRATWLIPAGLVESVHCDRPE